MKLKIAAIAGVSAIALLGGPAVTYAADAAAAAETSNSVSLEEVTVTARKRAQAEILQQAPITATVVTGKQLEAANAVNLIDVGHLTPGVSFQMGSGKSNANFSVRGVGISGTTSSDAPAVGIFQDGVYWGANIGSMGEMFDIAHVDVLRGPQGTLFGRNVTGGAIVIESNKPTFHNSLYTMLGYGAGNTMEGQLVLNGPLMGDTIAGRLAISGRRSDGLFKWGGGGKFGREDMLLVRPSITIKPTEKLTVTLHGEYYLDTGDTTPVRNRYPYNFVNVIQTGNPAAPTNPSLAPPVPVAVFGYKAPSDWTVIYNLPRGQSETTTGMLAGEAHYELPVGELTYIGSYRRVVAIATTAFGGTPFPVFVSPGRTFQSQYSNEGRYAADFGKISLTTGLYQFHQEFTANQNRATYNAALGGLGPYLNTSGQLLGEDAYGIYAEADYHITDALNVTLGGRYSSDKKEARSAPFGQCDFNFQACNYGGTFTAESHKFTPKVGVDYKITPANMVYASYTQGVRDGGYSLRGTILSVPYLPETVDSYEIGSKNDFFDHRLRVNVSVYDQKYKDIQKTVIQTLPPPLGIQQLTQNAARADIKGFEIATNWQVTSDFRVDANYGNVKPRYKQLTPGFVTVLNYPGVTASSLRFARVPENTANLILNYDHKLAEGASVFARASASYQSSYFFDDRNTIEQKGFTLYDASAGYTFADGATSLSVWGKNLSNQEHYEWGSNGGVGGYGVNLFAAQPRSYGVRISRTFE